MIVEFARAPETTDAYEAGRYCRHLLIEAELSLNSADILDRVAQLPAVNGIVETQNRRAADAALAQAWKAAIDVFQMYIRNRHKPGFLDGLRETRNDAPRVVQDAPQPS